MRLGLVIGLDQDTTIFLLPEKGYRMENKNIDKGSLES